MRSSLCVPRCFLEPTARKRWSRCRSSYHHWVMQLDTFSFVTPCCVDFDELALWRLRARYSSVQCLERFDTEGAVDVISFDRVDAKPRYFGAASDTSGLLQHRLCDHIGVQRRRASFPADSAVLHTT